MSKISSTAKIHKNVTLGTNVTIEDFCIIGSDHGETVIGDNAIIRSHTVIYGGTKIGVNFQSGNKVNIRENCVIGENVSIGTLSVLEFQVFVEDNVRLHSQVFVPEFSKLCKGCWLGPNVVLTNAKYPLSANVKENLKGPIIKEGAIVGANSTLLPGVILNENVIIGAGSVITKDVPSGKVYAGNPGQEIKQRSELPYS